MRAAILLLLVPGCSLIASFDASRSSEASDALCSDGVDNDGDGLVDCQDWKCLSQPVCCNGPVIVLADDFAHRSCAQASCEAPDPSCTLDSTRWETWGEPVPTLCGGGLSPYKSELCYDVGALGNAQLPLHPGLTVSATVAGVPEVAGQLVVGLTRQLTVAAGDTACATIEGFQPVIAAIEERTQNGYAFVASFDHRVLGDSAEITDEGPHQIRLSIGADRRVTWLLDGTAFAQSGADQVLPPDAPLARLGLAGRGLKARFLDVRVSDGTQCDAPGAWTGDPDRFVALDGDAGGNSWDAFQVFAPAVTRVGEQVLLYYSGCTGSPLGNTCSQELGIGLATSVDAVSFARAPSNPLYPPRVRATLQPGLDRDPMTSSVVTLFISVNALASQEAQTIYRDTSTDQMQFAESTSGVLKAGPSGSWDDGEVCCASALPVGGGLTIWYAGHAAGDPTWRVGVARSTDGGLSFVEDPANPVVREGAQGEFDALGVNDPEVLFDATRGLYRMWYTGKTVLGDTSIGYAVSADGVRWHKSPGNPVLIPSDFGLEEVGSPAVLADEGELHLWLQGREPGVNRLRIYHLTNRGAAPNR